MFFVKFFIFRKLDAYILVNPVYFLVNGTFTSALVSQKNRRFSQHGDKIKQELFNQARKKIDVPSGIPEKTYGFPAT
jgi:hypothetical protein